MADVSGVAGSVGSGVAAGSAAGPWGALIGGGLGLVQGLMGSNAAERAASEQNAAAQQALELNKQRYGETEANLDPYIQAGTSALGTYQDKLGNLTQPTFNYTQPTFDFNTYSDPGAQYRIAQANKAITNSALAKGMTGGGALTSMAEKNQEMAGQAYQDAFGRYKDMTNINYTQEANKYNRDTGWLNSIMDRYGNLATSGQNAAGNLGQLGTGNAAAMTGLYTGIGGASATGTLGGNNALSSGLGQLANGIGQYVGQNTQTPGQVNNNLGTK